VASREDRGKRYGSEDIQDSRRGADLRGVCEVVAEVDGLASSERGQHDDAHDGEDDPQPHPLSHAGGMAESEKVFA